MQIDVSVFTMNSRAAYPSIYWARGLFDLLLPTPLGEGWGRGSPAPAPPFDYAPQLTTASPHPSPLPEGEGTSQLNRVKKSTIKLGAAYAHSYWPRALFDTPKAPRKAQKPLTAEAQRTQRKPNSKTCI